MGEGKKTVINYVIPILCSIMITPSVKIILRKFKHITAIEAIQISRAKGKTTKRAFFPIDKDKWLNINVLLGVKDIFLRFKTYLLLNIVFIISTFILIVSINFLNTISSPEFIHYTGVGKSDIRIDIQNTSENNHQMNEILTKIRQDNEVRWKIKRLSLYFRFL
ncbi:MAG: hypothetical protein LBM95_06500 [Lactobacillales bacterium]|jgi:putative ABC transport system permease protein|nr:hypothetical protein [Lactobacillales bacterium]